MIKLIGTEEIDLALTLVESAQSFMWTERNGAHGAVLYGLPVWLWAENGGVYADGCDVARLRAYLDLDRDYGAIAAEYAAYGRAAEAMRMYPGLRLLNQPAWETLAAFIISANNNVSRIRTIVQRLMEAYGDRFDTPRGVLYSFPTPERLAACAEGELRALGMGYRDRYLIETARAVAGGFPLDQLREMEYESAHKQLTSLMGVGDKVADCVQLFGLGHTEAFPVDVWIARMTKSVFGIGTDNRKLLGKSARALLGKNAGILQQFLFHAARTGAMEV
jgi:N-glycosylase/DNA lyase